MSGIIRCSFFGTLCGLFVFLSPAPPHAQTVAPPVDASDSERKLQAGLQLSKDFIAEFANPSLTGCAVGGGGLAFFDRGLAMSIPSVFLGNKNWAAVTTDQEGDHVIWQFITQTCAVEITIRMKSLKDGQMSYQPVTMPNGTSGQ